MKLKDLSESPQARRFLRDGQYFEAYREKLRNIREDEKNLLGNGGIRVLEEENSHPLNFLWDNFLVNRMLKGWREKRDAQRIAANQAAKLSRDVYCEGREFFLEKILFQYNTAKQCIEMQNLKSASYWIKCLTQYLRQNRVYLEEYEKSNSDGVRAKDVFSRIADLQELIDPKPNPEPAEDNNCQANGMETNFAGG